jgi:membrane-associated phospholipid phosphatase
MGEAGLTAKAMTQAEGTAQVMIRPLLPAAARSFAWLLTACCAFIVVGLAVLFARHTGLDWLDRSVDPRIQSMYQGQQDLPNRLALPGNPIPVAVTIVVIAVICLVIGRLNGALLAAVAIPAASVLAEHVLKPLVGRTAHGFLSYPSGHGTVMFALAAVLVVLTLPPPRARVLTLTTRLIVPVAAIALACDISVLVIGVGVHYFTDTIAGAALGTGTVAATALVLDLPGARRWLAVANERLRNLQIRRAREEALRG